MSKIYIIYRAFYKNKSYVGFTSFSLRRRIQGHLYKVKNNSKGYFHNVLRKYKNFEWEILEQTNSFSKAVKLEKFYIKKYNSFMPNGYNMTLGGEGTIGLVRSAKYKKEKSKSMKKLASNPKSALYKLNKAKKIKVKRSDGKIFNSISEAAKETKVSVSNIYNILTGINKTAKGYSFTAIKNKKLKNLQKFNRNKRENFHKKKIIDNNGKIYDSLTEAAECLKLCVGNISRVLSGHRTHTQGYTFNFLEK